jgi:hypothetical protein
MLSSGRFYAFADGLDKPETIGTLAEVQGALGLKPSASQAPATAPKEAAGQPQSWQVTKCAASLVQVSYLRSSLEAKPPDLGGEG